MTHAAPYILENAGIDAFDVFTKDGRFAGLIVRQRAGHWKHYYNGTASRGSSVKFPDAAAALANIDKRRARLAAKKAAA